VKPAEKSIGGGLIALCFINFFAPFSLSVVSNSIIGNKNSNKGTITEGGLIQ
jgi:hypothetical protein